MRSWFAAMTVRRADTAAALPSDGSTPGGGVATPASEPTPEAIRAALDQVLQSAGFDAPARARRFLAYIVDETLAGRAERIKAYSIATDVFGRGANFDAHSDPIVRLEAGRLRRALEQYYQSAGRDDPIVISIPKGAYVPEFAARPRAEAPAPEVAAQGRAPWAARLAGLGAVAVVGLVALVAWAGGWAPWTRPSAAPALPRLLVRPIEDLSGAADSSGFARGLTQEILGQMAKFRDIVTVEGGAAPDQHGSRYVLLGAVSLAGERLRLQVRLLDAEDVSVLWAQTYEADFKPDKVLDLETDFARRVATAVGQPYGAIYKADAGRPMPAEAGDWASYSCTLSYFTYRANLQVKAHPEVRKCLEETVERFPGYATAWALLAQTYIDEVRFHYPVAVGMPPASLERATVAAKRAVELDPQNVRALQAEMLTLYFDGQLDAALQVGAQALATNPNDTELMGEYGVRIADSGDWDRGCKLIADALDRNPGPLGYYEVNLAICAYIEADYKAATTWIRKAAVLDNPVYHLIAVAVFAEAGLTAEAVAERVWLEARAPGLVADVGAWVGLRNVKPADRERFFNSLRKAGFVIGTKS